MGSAVFFGAGGGFGVYNLDKHSGSTFVRCRLSPRHDFFERGCCKPFVVIARSARNSMAGLRLGI